MLGSNYGFNFRVGRFFAKALCALLCLYRHVLERDLVELAPVVPLRLMILFFLPLRVSGWSTRTAAHR